VGGQSVIAGATHFPFGGVRGWPWGNSHINQRSFDPDGRIASLPVGPDAGSGAAAWSFGYDTLDRLNAATLPTAPSLA
jgi:hypothetical protein